ncbi:hypothetical protein BC629DRAFT_1587771 [Irpex lacteus]|nr:hypothetical protein BC629DRAFT_1587771 [Irpex lacteus]
MISLAKVASLAVTVACATSLVQAWGPRVQCVETYRPKSTESCQDITAWSAVPVSTIEEYNPGITCNAPINQEVVCLRQFTPVCTLNVTATETTCNYLLKPTTNVTSVAQFVQMNDNVDDKCDNLVIGEPYCVSEDGCEGHWGEGLCQ